MRKGTKRAQILCVALLTLLISMTGCENKNNEENNVKYSSEEKSSGKKKDPEEKEGTGEISLPGGLGGNEEERIDARILPKQSFWIKGTEVAVLDDYGDNDAVVKFCLGGYVVQMVVPKELINDKDKITYEQYFDFPSSGYEQCPYYLLKIDEGEAALGLGGNVACIRTGMKTKEIWRDEIKRVQEESEEEKYALIADDSELYLLGDGFRQFGFRLEDAIFVVTISDSHASNVMNEEQLRMTKAWIPSEEDFIPVPDTKDYASRLDAAFEKLKKIEKKPSQEIYDLLGGDNGISYYGYELWDLTSDGIPEMLFYGNPRNIAIIGENSAYQIYAGELVFSSEPGVLYGFFGWQEDTSWTKYQFEANSEGELICHEETILETKEIFIDAYHDNLVKYYVKGQEVDKDTYEEAQNAIGDPLSPSLILNRVEDDEENAFVDKNGFFTAGRRLNGVIRKD